jgi:endonuclease YncB( thermonuclease family)
MHDTHTFEADGAELRRERASHTPGMAMTATPSPEGPSILLAVLALSACDAGYAKPVKMPSAGEVFSCQPTRVWDGDTFRCSNGLTIRLAGVAAREVRQVRPCGGVDPGCMADAGCSPGHPCPATSGLVAREALARMLNSTSSGTLPTISTGHLLIGGPPLACTSNGPAGAARVGAFCVSARVGDLSCRMVQGGYALRWAAYWGDHRC